MTRAPRPQTLTPQELPIMKVIWRLGSATVREVYEALRAKRSIAYTTVMTMMNVLEEKGYLKKQRADRAFRYKPTRSRQQVVTAMVREFVNRVFDGAAQPLMLHLVKTERLSHQDRAELRRMMDEPVEPGDEDEEE